MLLMGKRATIRDSVTSSVSVTAAPLISTNAGLAIGEVSSAFIREYSAFASALNTKRIQYRQHVDAQLAIDKGFSDYRSNGVGLAREYERADLIMGGNGSRNYTPEERAALIETGSAEGLDGHHINSVGEHRDMQADPDNIVFLTKEEHLEAHNGNWQNQTEGKLIDRNKMIRRTNTRRVFHNELKGLGISAAIGFGVGVTISAVIQLSLTGLKDADLPLLMKRSLLSGVEAAAVTSVTYAVGRGAHYALGTLFNIGPSAFSYVLSVGALSAAVGVVYQLVRMRMMGVPKEVAYDIAGKTATVSLLSVALSALATAKYGLVGGTAASIAFTVFLLAFNVGKNIHDRVINEKISLFTIEQQRPVI